MTHFEAEIRSQGAVLRARAEASAEAVARLASSWDEIDYALVAARGSSDNAARYFQYVLGQRAGLLVALAAPSLFEDYRHMRLGRAGVLAISQSGRSPGMVEVLRTAQAQGRPASAMTNYADSPLAQGADVLVDLAAGSERAIASTKTFSATWHALSQLASQLSATPLEGLDELGEAVDHVADWALGSALPIELLDAPRGLTIIGRGVGYAAASETALKVREVSGLRAEAFAASDYLHGPIGADGAQSATLLLLTDELTDAVAEELLMTVRALGASTVVVRPPQRRAVACDAQVVLPSDAPNWALGLLEVVLGQVLTLRLGERRGRAIDTSPVLSKVTTSA